MFWLVTSNPYVRTRNKRDIISNKIKELPDYVEPSAKSMKGCKL